jgi:glutamine synthetase
MASTRSAAAQARPALCALHQPDDQQLQASRPRLRGPVNLAYSRRNRSASVRIPVYSPSPKAKRVEFRCPDGSSNPYLAFSAMLMAMLDGIKNQDQAGRAARQGHLRPAAEELARVPKAPGSLDEALDALEKDHEFLLQGEVFTKDVISTWIWYKRTKEVDAIRLRPHPYEFMLYFDANGEFRGE